ncbi:MAG: RNA-directed DNA polymerase [Mangrovibacterium sp.]
MKRTGNPVENIIDSYEVTQEKGIPIGNLTSQYFANYYLSGADHYAKEILKIKGYVRYMDDILLFANDKYLLKNKLSAFRGFIEENLLLELKHAIINSTTKGVSFLGYVLLPNRIKLNQNSKRRFCRKIGNYQRLLDNGKWSQQEYSRHVLPLIAFTEYANSKHLRSKIINYDN